MEIAKFRPVRTPKPLNRLIKNLAWVIMCMSAAKWKDMHMVMVQLMLYVSWLHHISSFPLSNIFYN